MGSWYVRIPKDWNWTETGLDWTTSHKVARNTATYNIDDNSWQLIEIRT
jgi:hypothetical protein